MQVIVKFFKYSFLGGIIVFILGLAINSHVLLNTKKYISTDKSAIDSAYTVIVLGAKVYNNGGVSTYLKNRLDKALELYKVGKVKRFLLSGDHGTKTYDEVNTMKSYLMKNGVPIEDIFLDHAGFNTYNSMIRAKEVFLVDKAVIVSQDYHLPRAVYIANKVGLKAQGYASSSSGLPSISFNKKREVLARIKSFGEVALGVKPKFLGDEIPIEGSSLLSHD